MQPQGAPQKIALPNIRYLVAVASGKGGVGKSTVAVNLAMALRNQGHRVGVMDADIYGPSIPTLLGLGDVDPQTSTFPLRQHGLAVMSMGFLLGSDKAAVLRGPMVQKYLIGFLTQVDWGPLDFLLVDMPPGTGDAQLALAQVAPVAGVIVVTLPQEVSQAVARRGLLMFRQTSVPVLGVVENMSYLLDEQGNRQAIFGEGGGRRLAEEFSLPFLGEIPLDPRVAQGGDTGQPIVLLHPEAPASKAYDSLATQVVQQLQTAAPPKELPELQF